MKILNNKVYIAAAIIAVITIFGIGYVIGNGRHDHDSETNETGSAKVIMYTCSMHPSVRSTDPNKKCPICSMDLIPLVEDEMAAVPTGLKVTEDAQKLAQIETAKATRQFVTKEVRLIGMVEYDETRLATITSWIPGRLDRLYVDYTGITVKKGDHMVYIYSPEILSAEQELIEAKHAFEQVQNSDLANVVDAAKQTLEASREKLRLWGLSKQQVQRIEASGKPEDNITINAPIGGIVIHKNASEGQYVKTGTPIYQIADLSQVWVQMDAYESDLPWLRYGQEVEFSAEALPGRELKGRISFISPTLNPKSRTVKIRVNVPNDGNLKPGMFVRATVKSRLAEGGNVFDDSMAGKWISPMHPEVVKDEPGPCDVCGMPLVKAETLGFVSQSDTTAQPPLVVPATAPLMTGRRAVVYVQNPSKPEQFEGKTVILGPRAGDFIVIESGLNEGEIVVVNGNFKIDSELQIQAKGSMMNTPYVFDVPDSFRNGAKVLFNAYFDLQTALSGDAFDKAAPSATAMLTALRGIDAKPLSALPKQKWLKLRTAIRDNADVIIAAKTIDTARKAFDDLSKAMITFGKSFGTGLDTASFIHHCPMAFDNTGASWLQTTDDPFNPYFGSKMLKCASLEGRIPGNAWNGERPTNERPKPEPAPNTPASPLGRLFLIYIDIQQALSKDNIDDAKASAGEFFSDLDDIQMDHDGWAKQKAELSKAAKAVFLSETLEAARSAFAPLSESLTVALPRFGSDITLPVYQVRCSMAFNNRGATWLQNHDKVENPYFGSSMYRCGAVIGEPLKNKPTKTPEHQGHKH